jgi:4-hydroxythreonine-4-phosphate dehydrogenase
MTTAKANKLHRPRIAVTLGDTVGIGPELVAKLLSKCENLEKGNVVVLADQSELDEAIALAGRVDVPTSVAEGSPRVRVLDEKSSSINGIKRSETSKESGERCMHQLKRGLELWRTGQIDGIVFAPLNKTSLKQAGMMEEDELRWFANQLQFHGTTSEINIAGPLWTARVTSHVGVDKVASMITKETTLNAIELLHRLRYTDHNNTTPLHC